MLNIFVCEDNPTHRIKITSIINNFILVEDLDMKIVVETDSPHIVLEYVSKNEATGLYFMDLDLGCNMNGIELASAIRAHDPRGFIVFITADAESHVLTFEYMIEAMSYIVKGDVNFGDHICKCITKAQARFTSSPVKQGRFMFKLSQNPNGQLSKGSTKSLDYENILYFEVSQNRAHNIVVQAKTSRHIFRGQLKEVLEDLDGRFIRCHRSYVVNVDHIATIDNTLTKLVFSNGQAIDFAANQQKKLVKLMMERQCT